MPAVARPTMSRTAAAPTATKSHRRVVMSHSDALGAQPTFHLPLDGVQALACRRLVPCDEHGLRIRCANEAPAVAEQDAHAVDIDHIVFGLEVFHGLVHEIELPRLLDFDAKLGRRYE